ncbi:MAG: septum formation initiator family protein [Desulfohalobiaceae bacterium]|nr:septum formation initiator family protein [Desulfohalobiaceae bacterium]
MNLKRAVFIVLLLLNLGLVLHVIWGEHGLLVYLEHKAIHHELQQRLHAVQMDNRELSRAIRLLKTDTDYQQQTVRQEFHVLGDNEILYLIEP